VKLYLSSEFYPYDDLNLDFDKRRAAILYDMYLHFRTSYYQIPRERNEPSFQLYSFLEGFILVTIDCSRQNESVKNDTVNVRLKFEFKCTREYNRLLPYHTRPRNIKSIVKCTTQDYVNYHHQKILSSLFNIV